MRKSGSTRDKACQTILNILFILFLDDKLRNRELQKSCLLDPVTIFLLKYCVDIQLLSITKLVNLSLAGHSTKTPLLHIKNEIHLSLSRGEPTALALLNLSVAFNTIDHTSLFNCLKS